MDSGNFTPPPIVHDSAHSPIYPPDTPPAHPFPRPAVRGPAADHTSFACLPIHGRLFRPRDTGMPAGLRLAGKFWPGGFGLACFGIDRHHVAAAAGVLSG